VLMQLPIAPTSANTVAQYEADLRSHHQTLFQKILESFTDGILIVTLQKEIIQVNACAHDICAELNGDRAQPDIVPEEIWQVCQILIENQTSRSDHTPVIDLEISTAQIATLRVRSCWLNASNFPQPCILNILEDRQKTAQQLATVNIEQYGLTSREAEVWLLRCQNFTYKQIAAELYITPATVKKHLRSIYTKQSLFELRKG